MIKEANFQNLKEKLFISAEKMKEANRLFKNEEVFGDVEQLEEISSLISDACVKAREVNSMILEAINDLIEG